MKTTKEEDVVRKFKELIENQENRKWVLQTEIPLHDMAGLMHRADARIVEKDDQDHVRRVIAYAEMKGEDADAKELQTGYAQCLLYADLTGSEVWYVISTEQVRKFLTPERAGKIDGRIKVYDIDKAELIDPVSISEKMGKSRMKRKMESPFFSGWSQDYEIEITTPLALTEPPLDAEGNVLFNTGTRIRGSLKEIAKTISGALSESVKYTIYVDPTQSIIGRKDELQPKSKFIPNKTRAGTSMKREYYELPPPRRLQFTVHCMNPKLTQAIVEELLRRAGIFSGVGDSHSDATHGRFVLIEPNQQ